MNYFRKSNLPAWCLAPAWLFVAGSVILWFAFAERADIPPYAALTRWGWAQVALLCSCVVSAVLLRFQFRHRVLPGAGRRQPHSVEGYSESASPVPAASAPSPEAIFSIAPDGTLKWISPAFAEITGHSCRQCVGQSVDEILHAPDNQKVWSLFAGALGGDRLAPFSVKMTHADGHLLELECTAMPESVDGSVVGVQALARAVTKRDRNEEKLRQTERMDFVGQLAAGVAHDFNNILTIQQSYVSELAELPDLPQEARAAIGEITAAGERAALLTRKLLACGRQQVMQPHYLDCAEFLRGMQGRIERLLGDEITYALDSDGSLPPIYMDDGMLEQVVTALVSNAHDAMPDGGAVVISTASTDLPESITLINPEARAGSFVVLTVADTGCGISPKNLHRIFEPFFTTKDAARVAGLGLPTVHGIIKQNNGWIEVESHVHEGTTFRIYLPAVPAPAPTKGVPVPAANTQETILVVEDELQLCSVVGRFLKRRGYNVLTAESGNEALKLWEQHQGEVDLLLTDLVMPEGMTGRELADRLLARQPDLKVLYTSGYSSEVAGRDLSLHGGFNFLPKPYQPSELAKVVRACLDER